MRHVLAIGFVLSLAGLSAAGCSYSYFRAEHEETCRSMGFEPKTELFAKCLLDLELARRGHARHH